MTANNVADLQGAFSRQEEGSGSNAAGSMTDFDGGRYLPLLDGLDISDDQKREFLATLWNMMRMCIEMNVSAESWGQISKHIIEQSGTDLSDVES